MDFWLPPVIITSQHALEGFAQGLDDDFDDSALAVREMTVRIRIPFSFQLLRLSLVATTFITDLVLLLPRDTVFGLLDDLRFPKLQLFKTNLPHSDLLSFLSLNDSITDLCLDICGGGVHEECPLVVLDFGHIVTIEGPVGCLPALTHSRLRSLTAQGQQHSPDTTTILRALPTPLSRLFELTLDVFPDDYDILRGITTYIPNVVRLKLLERPHCSPHRKLHTRRAWTNVSSWSGCLARLAALQDFALRTSSMLIRAPTLAHEQKLFVRWATKPSRATTPGRGHPTLTSLRVWYRSSEAGGGVLSYWSRSTGSWKNIARVVDPTPDTPF